MSLQLWHDPARKRPRLGAVCPCVSSDAPCSVPYNQQRASPHPLVAGSSLKPVQPTLFWVRGTQGWRGAVGRHRALPVSLSGWVAAAFSATLGTAEDAPACSSTPWRVFVVSWLTGSPASSEQLYVVSDGPQARPCAGAQGKGLGVSKAWAPPARRCCQGGPGTQALVWRPAE